jgi:hypothetical protein
MKVHVVYYTTHFFFLIHFLLLSFPPVVPCLLLGACTFLLRWLIESDPGTPSWKGEETCKVCGSRRTKTTHHCRFCRRCVEGFDHHCDVLDICVGEGNIFLFRLFLFLNSVLFLSCSRFHLLLLLERDASERDQDLDFRWKTLFFLFLDIVFSVVFSLFFLLHSSLGLAGVPWYRFMTSLSAS